MAQQVRHSAMQARMGMTTTAAIRVGKRNPAQSAANNTLLFVAGRQVALVRLAVMRSIASGSEKNDRAYGHRHAPAVAQTSVQMRAERLSVVRLSKIARQAMVAAVMGALISRTRSVYARLVGSKKKLAVRLAGMTRRGGRMPYEAYRP